MPIGFPPLFMDAAALPALANGKANWVLRASSFACSRRNRFPFKKASSLSLLQPAGLYSTVLSDVISSGSKQKAFGTVMAAKKSSEGSKEDVGRYKHTIDLPKTTFGMRANSVVREPEIQKLWEDNQVFSRIVERNTGGTFVLHDGPPYANGKLHMGHALNKILKDIINRYKLLRNYKVQFVPGWDCHGLPIELKVDGSSRSKGVDTNNFERKGCQICKRDCQCSNEVF